MEHLAVTSRLPSPSLAGSGKVGQRRAERIVEVGLKALSTVFTGAQWPGFEVTPSRLGVVVTAFPSAVDSEVGSIIDNVVAAFSERGGHDNGSETQMPKRSASATTAVRPQ